MSDLERLVRPQVLAMQPYDLPPAGDGIRLNANESAWRSEFDQSSAGLNRYPHAYPTELANRLAELYGVNAAQLVVTRGSDEAIDLLIRVFCREGFDEIIVCPPTFSMYSVYAQVQGAGIRQVPLDPENDFALDARAVLAACNDSTRLVFLCSPNNPSGQLLDEATVLGLTRALEDRAIVVLDEAYVEFAQRPSLVGRLAEFSNLVILRTLSKAYALAGARLGAAIASTEITGWLRRVLPPYAVSTSAVEAAESLIRPEALRQIADRIDQVRQMRADLARELMVLAPVRKVWPSDANFLLVKVDKARRVAEACAQAGILVRDFSRAPELQDCLRITVGRPEQNSAVLACIKEQENV
jgi:histidinol-phosphate aminotransferase